MARIAGVDLPREKRIEIGLTYIYGIGRASADKILAQAGVNPDIRVRDLTDDDVKKISAVIDETMMVEGDLRREIALNIKRLQELSLIHILKAELENTDDVKAAAYLGTVIGKKAVEAGIESVVFDRGGYIYHGKVKALADAAREAGLKF